MRGLLGLCVQRAKDIFARRLPVRLYMATGISAVMLAAVSFPSFAGEPKPPSLTALSAALIDGESGRILYEKDGDAVRPMASTTKIMTCILALENAGLDDTVKVSGYAASMPDVQLGIREGETYRLSDLLYSLMLESHNDTAVAVAEHVAGSCEAFAGMMNQKARDLGCTDTCFITPNGLDAVNSETGKRHATTAADLARIMRYCVSLSPKSEEFLAVTRAPSHTFSDLEGKRSFSCVNHNSLLNSMDGALSGKTGFTNGAGYCYVGAVEKDGRLFIAALLGCGWPPHKTYKWQDMQKLIRYGAENYEYHEIEKQVPEIPPAAVTGGFTDGAELYIDYPQEPLKVLMREDEPVTVRIKTMREISAPVEKDWSAGWIDYYVGGDPVAGYPIRIKDSVHEWNYKFCVKTLLKRYMF